MPNVINCYGSPYVTAFQVEGHKFKPGLVLLGMTEFICEIEYVIYHELFGELIHRGKTCTHLQRNLMICAMALTRSAVQALSLGEKACTQQWNVCRLDD